jgi:hypothetical protein
MQAFGDRVSGLARILLLPSYTTDEGETVMSMLGAGELCRAILEDKEVARAFDLDADGEMSLLSTYLNAAEHPETSRWQPRIVSLNGCSQTATQTLATMGFGGSISPL